MGEGELAERAQTSVAPDGACAAASPPAVPGGGQQQAYEDSELLKDKDAVFQFLFELRAKMKQDLEEQRQLLQRIYKVQCGRFISSARSGASTTISCCRTWTTDFFDASGVSDCCNWSEASGFDKPESNTGSGVEWATQDVAQDIGVDSLMRL